MEITLSKNDDGKSITTEISACEDLHYFVNERQHIQNELSEAAKAAEMIWKKYPKFKTITFNTLSIQEQDLIDDAMFDKRKDLS